MKTQHINVLYLVPSLALSGRGKSILNMVKGIDKSVYKCQVWCLEEKGVLSNDLEKIDIQVKLIKRKKGLDFFLPFTLAKMMKKEKIKVIHTHNLGPFIYGAIAGKIARVPCIINTLHYAVPSNTFRNKVRNKLAFYLADKIVVINNFIRNIFLAQNKVNSNKVVVINYGVNIDNFIMPNVKTSDEKKRIGLKPDCLIVGTVGRLIPEKDYETFLEAAKLILEDIQNIEFIIIGDGPLKDELQRMSIKLSINNKVHFWGFRNDIPKILRIFDVFVLPSISEVFGLVLLEAMATGIPIIATNVGGIPEVIINGETGILVPPKSPTALANAVINLLRDKELSVKLENNGRKYIEEKYNLAEKVKKYENLYQQILIKKGKKINRKIKVMQVVSSLNCGGLERVVISLIRAMKERNFEFILCCIEERGILAKEVENLDVKVINLNKKRGVSIKTIFNLFRIMGKEKVDIVHAHNSSPFFYGAFAAKIARVPIIIGTRHGCGKLVVSGKIPIFFFDKLITVSENAEKSLLNEVPIFRRKVMTILNGIEVDKYKLNEFNVIKERERLGLTSTDLIIGSIARLSPHKDFESLLIASERIFKELSNAKLIIVGDGESRNELEKLSSKLGIDDKVTFLGFRDDIPSCLSTFDVFVLSSYTEGLSLTLIEAMAAGKPVVATSVGGNPEVVVDGVTGFLVLRNNPRAMAKAILRILSEKDLAKKMGEEGYKRVKEIFSLDRMVRDYENLYYSLLENKKVI